MSSEIILDKVLSNYSDNSFAENIFISIRKNEDGLPVSKMIENEPITVYRNTATLLEIPDALFKVEINNMYEVDELQYLEQANQFFVDYVMGVVYFYSSVTDGTTINVNRYYGIGVFYIPSSRVYTDISTDGVIQTLTQYFDSIKSYTYKGIFTNTTTYQVNEQVYYNGSTYICLQECTGINPENVSYWSVMTAGLSMKGNWSSSETYRERDIVTVDGNKLYLALKSSTNQNPTTATTYWEAMLDLTTFATYLDQQIARANQEITALQNKIGEYNNTLKPDILDKTSKANQATTNANTATTNVNNALQEYKDSALLSLMIHKEPVETFAQIAISYPNPQNGWTVKVLADSKIYRYDGINANRWEFIDVGTGSAEINAINNKIGDLSQLNTTAKDSLVNAVKEVNNNTKNFATTAEAEAGLDDTKLMTPKKVKESIKANATGGGVSLQTFKSGAVDGTFTSTVATDNFTIPNWNTRKDIENMVHENLFLVKDQDYSINQSTGLVTLTWTLAIGDKIHWKYSNQSYDYNELVNTPNIGNTESLTTTSKEVVGAINEVKQYANDIKNSWANVIGSPLINTDTTAQLNSKTQTLKNTMATNLTNKGQSSQGTETLSSLIEKIPNIITGSGNAVVGDVLSGKTFTNSTGGQLTGTMPNRGSVTNTITTQNGQYAIPQGYHDGTGKVTATFPVAEKKILTATNQNQILSVPAGYYTEASTITANITNLTPNNIAKGINVGGITGIFEGGIKYAEGSFPYDTTNSFSVTNIGWKANLIIVQWYTEHTTKATVGQFVWADADNRPTGFFYHINNSGYTMQVNWDVPIDEGFANYYVNGCTWQVSNVGFAFINSTMTSYQKSFKWYAFKTK